MSILTSREILSRLNKDIIIDPFNIKNLNPNSYNLTLHDEIKFYDCDFLDMKKDNPTKLIKIPNDGLWLKPGETYLGRTMEYTVTKNLVPIIKARSSIARLHIHIINSAGFGDIGYSGHWTIPISVIKKTKVYPFVTICQIYYSDIIGEIDKEYNIDDNKYQNSRDIMASKIYKEFDSNTKK
jgi:dCTP deaminase